MMHVITWYIVEVPNNVWRSGLLTVTGETSTKTGGANPISHANFISSCHSKAPPIHSPITIKSSVCYI